MSDCNNVPFCPRETERDALLAIVGELAWMQPVMEYLEKYGRPKDVETWPGMKELQARAQALLLTYLDGDSPQEAPSPRP